jgi:hypothetical protein
MTRDGTSVEMRGKKIRGEISVPFLFRERESFSLR